MRSPEVVMDPERLAATPSGPFSFSRIWLTKMLSEAWRFERSHVDLDENGHGVFCYRIVAGNGAVLTAVMVSGEGERNDDRVFSASWDILAWLVDGEVDAAMRKEIIATADAVIGGGGQTVPSVLSMTRGNRSSRLFGHIVERLAEGRQPDPERLARVGYVVRNIFYQANGMNGTRMFGAYRDDHPLAGAFAAQMAGLYLMRQFSIDLVEAVAKSRNPAGAATLSPAMRRYVGVGNSTGIGLNLLAWTHPAVVGRWIMQREAARAALLASGRVHAGDLERLIETLARAARFYETEKDVEDIVPPGRHGLSDELRSTVAFLQGSRPAAGSLTWTDVLEWVEAHCGVEAQEVVGAIAIGLFPELVLVLADFDSVSEDGDIDPVMTVLELSETIESQFGWALERDLEGAGAPLWTWYKSEEGEEPRRVSREDEEVSPEHDILLELPRLLQSIKGDLDELPAGTPVGYYVATHPEKRDVVARIQATRSIPFHTPRQDLHAADTSPLDLTRLVLCGFKGMDSVRIMGNLWCRGVFLQGAPTIDELPIEAPSDWTYPDIPDGEPA
jgi:hypothetical protein